MRVLHWCMLGVTILLLVCEITTSQLCKSLITLVDGFHTLFVLISMALPPPQTAGMAKPQLLSLDSSTHPPQASSSSSSSSVPPSTLPSIKPPPATQQDQAPTPQPNHDTLSVFNSQKLSHPEVSPACGVSYTDSRIQPVGAFFSTLLLGSLCISYLLEIISFSLKPHQVQHPLLLVVVGAVGLLHKMLLLKLNWNQLHNERAGVGRRAKTESHLEVTLNAPTVLAEERTKEPGRVLYVQSALDSPLHNGALVLCNPGTSSVLGTDSHTSQHQPETHLHAAAPQHSQDSGAASGVEDQKTFKCASPSKAIADISKDCACMRPFDSQDASKASPVCNSSHHFENPVPNSHRPACMLSFILFIQGLFTSFLALVNGLVMLLLGTQCLHGSEACSLLVYLDPGLSLLAVIVLIATARPQMCRYGLLLLQATPAHISVSDVERRIASVPGVKAVHDLHIWQLAESLMVASVHVHCHAGFPAYR
uniref:Zinc/cadmium resistance protein-like n=2 Tax=Mastacembelus armatus TaxID=205130 RepID=A0A3Q3M6R5_9TELE